MRVESSKREESRTWEIRDNRTVGSKGQLDFALEDAGAHAEASEGGEIAHVHLPSEDLSRFLVRCLDPRIPRLLSKEEGSASRKVVRLGV